MHVASGLLGLRGLFQECPFPGRNENTQFHPQLAAHTRPHNQEAMACLCTNEDTFSVALEVLVANHVAQRRLRRAARSKLFEAVCRQARSSVAAKGARTAARRTVREAALRAAQRCLQRTAIEAASRAVRTASRKRSTPPCLLTDGNARGAKRARKAMV